MDKKYVTPLLSHWSYVVLALTHRYILHWTVSSLDQTVASLLFGIKPLSEPMQTCFQLNHKENVSMKYHLKCIIFSQENVFEYAVWNGNHLVSTEMRFNHYLFSVDWKVSIKASETYMVYLWVTISQCIVLIFNFTGQLIHKLKNQRQVR